MKRILCSLLVASLPFGSALADAPISKNAKVTTYTAGQSFSELPGQRHNVSANASETKPARALRFRLNRKCSRSLSASVIHASLAIPPEAITL
jgi:hypothetical protein